MSRPSALPTRPDGVGGPAAQLSPDAQRQVAQLKQRDAEVRRHEQAHAAAGGAHTGAPHYQLEKGPDGQLYAVGGEVAVDASPVHDDPRATILKMQQVVRAALAPADPSGQDQLVAAAAAAVMARARVELAVKGAAEVEGAVRPESDQSAATPRTSPERSQAMSAYLETIKTPETPSLNLIACADCGQSHSR